MSKRIRAVGAGILVAVWAALTLWAWFGPAKDISEAERRPLQQFPTVSGENLLNGKFMTDFEDYSLDQFPLRDTFRKGKALFHYNILRQGDNNDIYIAKGYAAKQDYPLNEASVRFALSRFQTVYDLYLKDSGSAIFSAIVPDKSYYLAEANGYLAMDYGKLFTMVREGMPWATHVDITDCLTIDDYYRTDTHWRQERLLKASEKLCQALGVTAFTQGEMTVKTLDRPFYGVYYGQAALPMDPDTISYLDCPLLEDCRVTLYETGSEAAVYDMEKLTSRDLYDVFLSGAQALLTIENPGAQTDRELIVFRDSFGSSMTPLLLRDYQTVTVVDLRYLQADRLGDVMDFHGQDVLFLYSTLVLNSNALR